MTTLSERAMLVTLNISQWTARKLDRRETNAVNAKHGLTVEAARVHKDLLPLGAQLDRVHQMTGAIRKDFAKRTLPWGIDGVNILKSSGYLDFTGVVNQWHADWQGAVDEFVEAYPTLLDEARLLLNTLFREEDYPTTDEIRRRFGFSIKFMPVPDERDWRIDVGDAERDRLTREIRATVAAAEGEAMRAAWQRVYDVVSRAAERLSNPENVFRDTLVENAVELCGILPSLNLTDDPEMERVRQQLEGSLCAYAPDVLRSNPQVREQVAGDMADLMQRMAGFFPAQAA